MELLDCIDAKGTATHWDLVKILGNTDQFQYWIEEFLLKEKLIEEYRETNRYWYQKTETEELFHTLIKNS